MAKGFTQVKGVNVHEIYSPVVKHSSIRALLAMVAMKELELYQLDMKTTFLHGELEEEIYMSQPEGFEVDGKEIHWCHLKKSLYGLKNRQGNGTRNLTYLCFQIILKGVIMIVMCILRSLMVTL